MMMAVVVIVMKTTIMIMMEIIMMVIGRFLIMVVNVAFNVRSAASACRAHQAASISSNRISSLP